MILFGSLYRRSLLVALMLAAASSVAESGRAQDVDPALKPYHKVAGEVAGSLKCVGSDTMNNLVALWAEGF
jgi:phosphate transport system substrate-binding protein